MNIEPTADQKAYARDAIQAGRLHTEADVVEEALQLWEDRERNRAELIAAIDAADVSIAAGYGRALDEAAIRVLSEQVKQRGRDRLTRSNSEIF
jgi:Arc/MetJ-type ribon-helix-helix transcriptional regulator